MIATDTKNNNDDDLFVDDNVEQQEQYNHLETPTSWKILIVDDEEDIHTITKLTLSGFNFKGKPLSFLSAYSAKEAEKLMIEHPDITLILLDVIMEEEDSGLKLVEFVREKLKNRLVRIILRTGQPGVIQQSEVAISYDIDNYQEKTELTREKFLSVIVVALRSYQLLEELYKTRQEIEYSSNTVDKFVPHAFLNLLNKNSITDISIGDCVEQEMVVLFLSTNSFADLSKSLSPKEHLQFINSWMDYLLPVITEYNGFIDKYINDAVMTLFYGSCDSALLAAHKMLKRAEELNIDLGMGVNVGKLVLGALGFRDRIDCTAISEVINTTVKLEELNKKYGTHLLVTEQVIAKLNSPENFNFRWIGNFPQEKSKNNLSIYEIFDTNPEAIRVLKQQTKTRLIEGIKLYQANQRQEALVIFTEILQANPADTIALAFSKGEI